MRNVVGPLNEKVLSKYDLKGSTLNRETKIDVDNIGQIVLKDNNFKEIEHFIFMDESEIERLRNNTKLDSCFLSNIKLMDYSLFLVKITLNKKEIKEIFENNEINEYYIKKSTNQNIEETENETDDKTNSHIENNSKSQETLLPKNVK